MHNDLGFKAALVLSLLNDELSANGGAIQVDWGSLALRLHTDTDTLKAIVSNYGLFIVQKGMIEHKFTA